MRGPVLKSTAILYMSFIDHIAGSLTMIAMQLYSGQCI